MFFIGFSGEIWLKPGKPPTRARAYVRKAAGMRAPSKPEDGKVSLVLAPGNMFSVSDVLQKLICDDEVVILKLNPINDYIGEHLLRIYKPFVDGGWLQVAYGGKEVGEYISRHDGIDTIHLTGSVNTFNTMVWGSPTADRKGSPLITKPFSAELGSVTPYIVVPPPAGVKWTEEEIRFQANQVASGLLTNSGHNCVSLEVLVTAKDWQQREQFMAELRKVLNSVDRPTGWYPGW